VSIIDKKILEIVSAYEVGRRFTEQAVIEAMLESNFKFTPNKTKITTTLKLSPLVSEIDDGSTPITFVRTEVTT
jgi:hypothetical protein